MFKKALSLIKKYDRIIIHRHNFPDGDALGSQLGLAALIKDNFKKKEVYVVGDEATRLPFMNGVMDEIPDEYYKDALAIILDCGSSRLICDDRYKTAAKTLRIDHHIYCEAIADVDIVDSTYESACGMVAMLAMECKLKLSPASATALYTGMVTDSGRFVFDSVSARTFALAAFLMTQPIDLNTLYYNLYSEEFDDIITKADNMHKIKFTPNRVAYIYTAREDLPENSEAAPIVSTGLVGLMRDIKGVHAWVNFTEGTDGLVHTEIRSNRYNINPIAVKYGGGGHKKASGCTVPDKETAMKLLDDLDALAASGDKTE
ncbi:MAG: bifunctional oligoribonuclease/PAP phosphatase NrnA [Clostridiales bacterium]|nr:bifunctional oligoribonuclease/PAP phosphatase NrnA [Clostridiales bacterium]